MKLSIAGRAAKWIRSHAGTIALDKRVRSLVTGAYAAGWEAAKREARR